MRTKISVIMLVLGCLITGVFGAYWYTFMYLGQPPTTITMPTTYELPPGATINKVATDLAELGVIRSDIALRVLFAHRHDARDIKAGTYKFTEPQPAAAIAEQLVTGQFAHDLLSVTFIEGTTVDAYGQVAAATLPGFDQVAWTASTSNLEGKLFPETYFVPQDYTTTELVDLLAGEHEAILQELRSTYSTSTLSDDEVRILASILEREANDEASMRMVAGILLNRLAIDMPLQADATIEYVLDTPLNELPPGQLANELREVESPYNTYKIVGLPPTPISNPGRTALMAALNPQPSDNLYYITGNDGMFYYAETYDQHLINIERHLR